MARTLAALAVENDIVASDVELAWDEPPKIAHTRLGLEYSRTPPALEIVMVAFARYLETGRLARQFDEHDDALFDQCFNGPVDRRHAQSRFVLPGRAMNLGDRERARGAEGTANGVKLPRMSNACRHQASPLSPNPRLYW